MPLVQPHLLVELAFAPVIEIAGLAVRLDTLAIALAGVLALILAALIARRTPVDATRPIDALDEEGDANHLRADDLLYIVVAALPGAFAGGRLGYILLHHDFYTANPSAMLDVSQGGLGLSFAVMGGVLTGSVVAMLLGAPLGRWLHVAILPLLLALSGAKFAMALGGAGQGAPSDGAWSTAYLGSGPWLSLAPELPSHPSQVYEGTATLVAFLFIALLLAAGAFPRRGGSVFFLGLGFWAFARMAVASTWRDPAVFGALNMEQVVCALIGAASMLVLVWTLIAGMGRSAAAGPTGNDPAGSRV